MKIHPWAAATAAFAAGTLAAVGIAEATSAPTKIPDSSSGVITACMVKKTGAVRFINAQAGKTCTSKEKKVTFNQTGPAGPTGPEGATGPSETFVKDVNPAWLSTPIPTAGANINSLTLPAGNYVLHAQTSLWKYANATQSMFCEFRTTSGTLKSTAAFFNPKPQDPPGSVGAVVPMGMTATLTDAGADTTVNLFCKANDADAGALGGSTMTATKVGQVTIQ
jgi:hypothetical protein